MGRDLIYGALEITTVLAFALANAVTGQLAALRVEIGIARRGQCTSVVELGKDKKSFPCLLHARHRGPHRY